MNTEKLKTIKHITEYLEEYIDYYYSFYTTKNSDDFIFYNIREGFLVYACEGDMIIDSMPISRSKLMQAELRRHFYVNDYDTECLRNLTHSEFVQCIHLASLPFLDNLKIINKDEESEESKETDIEVYKDLIKSYYLEYISAGSFALHITDKDSFYLYNAYDNKVIIHVLNDIIVDNMNCKRCEKDVYNLCLDTDRNKVNTFLDKYNNYSHYGDFLVLLKDCISELIKDGKVK